MSNLPWPSAPIHLCWAEVDLGAIRKNFITLRSRLQGHQNLYGVVKADGYGHGAIPVAHALLECGCQMLCVARIEEALELRNAGVTTPILLFTPPFDEQAEAIIEHNIVATVASEEHLQALEKAASRRDGKALTHLKIDTGMGRLGLPCGQLARLLQIASNLKHIRIVGAYSHLPCADETDPAPTLQAIKKFTACENLINSIMPSIKTFHLSNTAGILRFPQAHFTAARSGISLYGQYPSADMIRNIPLIPSMSLRARIIQVKTVPPGTGIGYGHTWVSRRESIIGTVAIGYADGYPRHASNLGTMLLQGQHVPVIGRVCMDQTMLDITDAPNAKTGDIVTAFGTDGDNVLRPEDVAVTFGSIGYELTTRVGKRVPRFYIANYST